MLISSQYYTKSEQPPRFSLWYCVLGLGQILGGVISFAFQHIKSTHFKSWQAMFVFVGLSTSLTGVATFLILPDSPMKAEFLNEAEKVALLKHIGINRTGIKNQHFKASQAIEVLFDLQLSLMTICTICVSLITHHQYLETILADVYLRFLFRVVLSQHTQQYSSKVLASHLTTLLFLTCPVD